MTTTPQYDFVNLGSTFALHGFGDYHYFPVNGLNLASAPQTLAEDLRKLHMNVDSIAKGAIIAVVICPFGFCVNEYSLVTAREMSNSLFAKVIRRVKYKFVSHARQRIEGWKIEFGLNNVITDKPSEELMRIFTITTNTLNKIIDFCTDNSFSPVIINMPVASVESSEFSEGFIDDFYTNNLSRIDSQQTQIFSYFKDERFADVSLYSNEADCLNDKGQQLFAEVLSADLRMLGLLKTS